MKPFYQRSSFPWYLVLAMVGINIGLLAFLWMGSPHRPPHPRPHIQVEDILGFDDAQRKAFKEMQGAHFERKDAIRKGFGQHRDSAFAQLKGGHPDSSIVAAHFAAMGAATQLTEAEIFDHFRLVRTMCRPEQLPKFDGELIEAITQPPKAGPGGPPHGGPPPQR